MEKMADEKGASCNAKLSSPIADEATAQIMEERRTTK
jgi:hypothetical protein